MPSNPNPAAALGATPDPSVGNLPCQRHLIVTVHGIRTFGRWQERFEALAKTIADNAEEVQFSHYKYGYFSMFAFLFPPLRWLVTLRFRKKLLKVAQKGEWDRIDLVGHSFGTHIIAWGLPIPFNHTKAACTAS